LAKFALATGLDACLRTKATKCVVGRRGLGSAGARRTACEADKVKCSVVAQTAASVSRSG
jgi:hypothetical protein